MKNQKKLFIETYGCQMNVADSEVVASIMGMSGYELTDNINEANAIFINTCSIRDNAEQKAFSRLDYFQSLKKKRKDIIIGVLGCMAERIKEDLLVSRSHILIEESIDKDAKWVEFFLKAMSEIPEID